MIARDADIQNVERSVTGLKSEAKTQALTTDYAEAIANDVLERDYVMAWKAEPIALC